MQLDDLKEYFDLFIINYLPHKDKPLYSQISNFLIDYYYSDVYDTIPSDFKSAYEQQVIPVNFYNYLLLSNGFPEDIVNKLGLEDKKILLQSFMDFNVYKGTLFSLQKVSDAFSDVFSIYELFADKENGEWVFKPYLVYKSPAITRVITDSLDWDIIANATKHFLIGKDSLDEDNLLLPIKTNLILLDYHSIYTHNYVNQIYAATILNYFKNHSQIIYFENNSYKTNFLTFYRLWYYILYKSFDVTFDEVVGNFIYFNYTEDLFPISLTDLFSIKASYDAINDQASRRQFKFNYIDLFKTAVSNSSINSEQVISDLEFLIPTDLFQYVNLRLSNGDGNKLLDELYNSLITWFYSLQDIYTEYQYFFQIFAMQLPLMQTNLADKPTYLLMQHFKPYHVELILRDLTAAIKVDDKLDSLYIDHAIGQTYNLESASFAHPSHFIDSTTDYPAMESYPIVHNFDLNDGLILSYDVTSYSGSGLTINDLSSFQNNGTLTNGPVFDNLYIDAISFDGINDSIIVPHNPSLVIARNMTICAWIKVTDTISARSILAKTTSNIAAPFDFYVGTNAKLNFLRGNGSSANNFGSTSAIALNTWQFVAVTMSGTLVTHYLNAISNGAGILNATSSDSAQAIYVGNRIDNASKMKGEIAQVQLYTRALSQAEIQDIFNKTSFRFGISPIVVQANTLWACGYNIYGRLGTNNTISYSSPIQVGSLTGWKQISLGLNSSYLIKDTGSMWSCGYNYYGQLGNNSTVDYSSPVQVGSLTNWSQVSAGTDFALATKTDGSLWGVGRNYYGQLGNGSHGTSYSSPIQIGALTNWSQISCNDEISFAIKTDGSLWGWGLNNLGALGNNNIISYSSPIQIGSLTNWKQVINDGFATFAVKTDGSLWGWGWNFGGRLCNGNTISYSSPIQIGSLTNWSQISNRGAIKSDGTLWMWGDGINGRLGNGTYNISYSSPIQIGTLTNWKSVSADSSSTVAMKTDRSLWAWGNNSLGQLGLSNVKYYSSPVQIGSLTNWSQITVNGAIMFILN